MKDKSREDIQRLFQRLCDDFGYESGMAIIRTIVAELGGSRVRVPSMGSLAREERTLKIQAAYMHGVSVTALADIWDITERHVHRELKKGSFIPVPPEV